MTLSDPLPPKPTPTRRYRYTKLRWRILVHVLDGLGSLARPYRTSAAVDRPPRRILVVQLDHLGDAVLTSPLFPRLKRLFPDTVIDVLASPSNHVIFETNEHVDHVHIAERNWLDRRPGGWALVSAVGRLARRLRDAGYDLAIDVRGDLLTVLVMALAGIPRRLGWAMGGGGFLLTDVADWVPGRHEVKARLALANELAPERTRIASEPARVAAGVTEGDRERIARRLEQAWPGSGAGGEPVERSPIVLVHLGAGTAAKRWPLRHWRALVGRFLDDGWRVVVVGGADDVGFSSILDPHPNLRDWSGSLTVAECAAALECGDLFIGADSGPAHLAAAAELASVILFSGTNAPAQWRPWSRKALVIRNRVSCSPCHLKTCILADHPCMTSLSPDRVYAAAVRWHRRVNPWEPIHV